MPLSVTYPEVKCSRKCHADYSRFRAVRPENRVSRWSMNAFMKHTLGCALALSTRSGAAYSRCDVCINRFETKMMLSRDRDPPITLAPAYWLGRIPSFAHNL